MADDKYQRKNFYPSCYSYTINIMTRFFSFIIVLLERLKQTRKKSKESEILTEK